MEKLTDVWKEQPDLRFGELIKNITHGNDMVNYNERQFLELIGNRFVITVKLADLKDNMNILRIPNPTKEDGQRIKKIYIPAYKKLGKRLEEIKFESNALEEFLKKQGVYTELKSLIDKWGNT